MPAKRKVSPPRSCTTSAPKALKTPSPQQAPKDEPGPAPPQGVLTDSYEWDEEEESMENASTALSEEPEKKGLRTAGRTPRKFDEPKSFKGQTYTGMAIGGSYSWTYDSGQWDETKEEPDLWKIKFEARKHRNRRAPKGSGAPVGTEYHWLIVAHQFVVKEDKDTYSTRMQGRKYKLAYKSVGSNSWSINTVKGQREREVELLEDAKSRVLGLPPVIGSQKVSRRRKEPGQRTLEQVIKGGAHKKVESEETKDDTSDKVSE